MSDPQHPGSQHQPKTSSRGIAEPRAKEQRVPGKGLSLAAMIVGIASLPLYMPAFALYSLLGVVAIVLGCVGFRKTKKATGRGSDMALVGVTTGSISVLTAIALGVFLVVFLGDGAMIRATNRTNDERTSRAAAEIDKMQKVISQYQLRFGSYPARLDQAEGALERRFPALDPWDRPYVYRQDSDGFVLRSLGADEADPTDDIVFDFAVGRIVVPSASRE